MYAFGGCVYVCIILWRLYTYEAWVVCMYMYGIRMHVYACGIMSSVCLCACDSVNW